MDIPWIGGEHATLQAWLILAVAVLLGLVAQAILFRLVPAIGRRALDVPLLHQALRHSRGPGRFLLPLVALRLALPLTQIGFSTGTVAALERIVNAMIVAGVLWLLIGLTHLLDDILTSRVDVRAADNLQARKTRTRTVLLRRVLIVTILVFGISILLLQFPPFRVVGTGLLASAGIIGIVIGVAAQRPISNLIAGLQIAITQPFRVDDVVIVEDEWGWIEEITLTYVVVRIWDLRRLVLPISHFVEHPFQNWTRTTSSILGTAFLHVDFSVPVDDVRAELNRIVESSEYWDHEICVLQVTDLTDRTMELRALVSASNAGRLWELRCEVRERLIAYLWHHHPGGLPRTRARIDEDDRDRNRTAPAAARPSRGQHDVPPHGAHRRA